MACQEQQRARDKLGRLHGQHGDRDGEHHGLDDPGDDHADELKNQADDQDDKLDHGSIPCARAMRSSSNAMRAVCSAVRVA